MYFYITIKGLVNKKTQIIYKNFERCHELIKKTDIYINTCIYKYVYINTYI